MKNKKRETNLQEKKLRELVQTEKVKEKAKQATLEFEREFKKEISTAMIGAFSLLIALTWREVITNAINKLSESSPVKGSLISALFVTLICVLGILFISKFNKKEKKDE